jgi:hypothetical protein
MLRQSEKIKAQITKPYRLDRPVIPILIWLVLIATSLYQSSRWYQQSKDLILNKVIVNSQQSAIFRGADSAFGGEFANFIEFIRNEVPDDGIVYLPREASRVQYQSKYYLQFFLFPRQVIYCGNALNDCLTLLISDETFILDSQALAGEIPSNSDYEVLSFSNTLSLIKRRP